MSEGALRTAIIVVALVNLAIGLFAAIAPGTFYDEIGTYGAKNGHYVGDVSTAYLAIGAGLLIAAREISWRVPLLAVTAVWWALHALNHLGDIDEASSTGKGVADTIMIFAGAVAIGYLGRVAARQRVEGRAP